MGEHTLMGRKMPIDVAGLCRNHYVGASSEHLAAAWFMGRDYVVLWPTPHQSNVDFVVMKDAAYQRVQVKTASWSKSGDWAYLQCRTRLTNRHQGRTPSEMYEIMFVVNGTDCWVIPSSLIMSSNISLGSNSEKSTSQWTAYRSSLVGPVTIRLAPTAAARIRPEAEFDKLTKLRAAGFTIKEIAAELKVSFAQVKRWLKEGGIRARASAATRREPSRLSC